MKVTLRSLVDEGLIKMTSSERMKNYLEGKPCDMIPFGLSEIENILAINLGFTKKEVVENFDLRLKLNNLKYNLYGLNQMSIGLDQKTVGRALGTKTYLTKHGDRLISNYILEDYKNFEKIENIKITETDLFVNMIERCHIVKKESNLIITSEVNGPISTSSGIRPIEYLLRDTRKDEKNLKKLLKLSVNYTLDWVRFFTKEIGPTSISVADGMSSLNVLSKDQFMKFAAPELERLIDEIHYITKIKPTLHICGYTNEIWNFIGNLNISAFSVDNCEDMGSLKETIGDKMMIVGNIDPVKVLLQGNKYDVHKKVKEILVKAGNNPKGLTISPGCSISEFSPIENINSIVEACYKYSNNCVLGQKFNFS